MTKSLRKASITGLALVAAGVGIAMPVCSYRDYINDPDIIKKIVFDISGEIEKEEIRSVKIHDSSLYNLLWKDDKTFSSNLEKECELFSREYKIETQGIEFDNHFGSHGFSDRQYLLSYLKSNREFLKKSLERGYFLNAAVLAYLEGVSENKVKMLLRKTAIQTYATNSLFKLLNVEAIDRNELTSTLMESWVYDIKSEITSIRKKPNKKVLSEYGETKQRILTLAKSRYQEFLSKYSNQLKDFQKKGLEEVFQ